MLATEEKAPPGVRSGVFLISAAVLLLQVVLTRIFSVVFWYHFAFVAVSVAMAGFAVSGIVLHALRHRVRAPNGFDLALGGIGFQIGAVLATVLALIAGGGAVPSTVLLVPLYIAAALPFFSAGWTVALALARWPREAGSIYGADLVGAALGAASAPVLLAFVDAPAAALTAGALAAAGAFLLAGNARGRRMAMFSLSAALLIVAGQVVLKPLGVKCPKGSCEKGLEAERWNHFSRVAVFGEHQGARAGFSMKYPGEMPQVRDMNIDAAAATPIVGWDGKLESLDVMRWDVTTIPYRVRGASKVFVAGAGGGPDLLTAHVYGATSVVAAEINPAVVEMTEERFGDFSGHPYRIPGITLALDDARSVLRRSDGGFDLVQMSCVDTFAAAAAGAFALTENNLYTRESFGLYLRSLSPRGTVSVSRWYRPTRPTEMLRLAVLARAALEDFGVEKPGEHMLAAAWFGPSPQGEDGKVDPERRWGVGLLVISPAAFDESERAKFAAASEELGLLPMWSGVPAEPVETELGWSPDPAISAVIGATDLDGFLRAHEDNLHPPTDDWPFFFQATRFRRGGSSGDYLSGGVGVLFTLVMGTGALAAILLILARRLVAGDPSAAAMGARSGWAAFGLGVGFIVIEIGLLQRFLLLLGHPTYAMAVVLPAILIAAAAGAVVASRGGHRPSIAVGACFAVVVLGLLAGWVLPGPIAALLGQSRVVKVIFSVIVLGIIGFPMGIPFPSLLKNAAAAGDGATAWLWAINGAASVFGSALAMMVSVFHGYSVAFTLGAAAYLLAALCMPRLTNTRVS